MARSDTTKLSVQPREAGGSRTARRMRRSGSVPGVVYGGGEAPVPFAVDARELRLALAHAGAVVDLEIDGSTTPVVLKDQQVDPVRGDTLHVDLLRVRLDQAISATVALELINSEEAPGVKEGGVLEHITREINVEALPNDIPDVIEHDVSAMEMNDTLTLSAVQVPAGVTFLDDLDETVVATLTPPRLEVEPEEEIESETELVGEEGEVAEAEAEGATGEEAESAASGSGDEG